MGRPSRGAHGRAIAADCASVISGVRTTAARSMLDYRATAGVSRPWCLVRNAATAIERCRGLIDEGRVLFERADRYTPTDEIKPIRCAHCGAEAPLVRREPMNAQEPLKGEIWTFECIRCALKMQQFDKH